MIGMMNCGSDPPVEFYASARQSSLYERKPSKDSRTYTEDGRVLINGVLEYQESPNDMWRSLIFKAVTKKLMKDMEAKDHGPLAVIRRLSSKFRLGTKSTVEIPSGQAMENSHVTIIRIKSIEPVDRLKVTSFSEGSGILKRLMEEETFFGEKKEIDREKIVVPKSNIYISWQGDSGRASWDENENNEVTVERF